MNIVTSFSPRGWHQYGIYFVETFRRHWPSDIRLDVFLEGQMPPLLDDRIFWHELRDDAQHEWFCKKNAHRDDPLDWNMMPVKFGHKVFAITSDRLPKTGWRVWLDADVITTEPVTQPWLDKVLPKGKALSCLLRRGIMRPGQPLYTECGFVGYNLDDPRTMKLLAELRDVFVSEKVFTFGQHNQHDSYAFDWCRKRQNFRKDEVHNLSFMAKENELHPWPKTELSKCLVHNKGPRLKRAMYGYS
jgi:hypothetical protein